MILVRGLLYVNDCPGEVAASGAIGSCRFWSACLQQPQGQADGLGRRSSVLSIPRNRAWPTYSRQSCIPYLSTYKYALEICESHEANVRLCRIPDKAITTSPKFIHIRLVQSPLLPRSAQLWCYRQIYDLPRHSQLAMPIERS